MKFFTSAVLLVAAFTIAGADVPSTPYKVYGNLWAWNNNYNDPDNVIKSTFGDGSTASMTTSFDFVNATLYGYPAILRGWHYNANPVPTDTLFPAQVSSLTTIPVTFEYSSTGVNMTGDFAYDIFFRWDETNSTPQLELMIWGDHNSWPIGTKTGTEVLTTDGRTFDLWEGYNDSAGYYVFSFVPTGTVATPGERTLATSGSLNVDVKLFTNYLQANRNGYFSKYLYMHVIETGFEVLRGDGSVTMTATINGY